MDNTLNQVAVEIIDQYHEYIGHCPTDFTEGLQLVERIGRTCYQTGDKISEGTYIPFSSKINNNGHWAMLEHSNMIFAGPYPEWLDSKYITIEQIDNFTFLLGGNYRAWMNAINCKNILILPEELKSKMGVGTDYTQVPNDDPDVPDNMKRIVIRFVTDRAVTHELVRHRPPSYAQLSQRYVDHLKMMQLINPVHIEKGTVAYALWQESCTFSCQYYATMREIGCSPQQARTVLPNSMATEIYVTADAFEWAWICNLRTSAGAYPQIRELIKCILPELAQDFPFSYFNNNLLDTMGVM